MAYRAYKEVTTNERNIVHNLHFAVIKANSPEEACVAVGTEISSWGDENNWRSIGGCVSDKDETYINDPDAHYYPNDDRNTIEKLNALVTSWITPRSDKGKETLKLMSKFIKDNKLKSYDWEKIEQFARFKKETCDKKNFNILKDDLYAGNYDECGVTHILTGEGKHKYVVFIDMHS